MNQKTIITLAVVAAAAGVGYYFWKKSKTTAPAATAPTAPAAGGGSGANSSTSSAYNGIVSDVLSLFGKGSGASAGHLPNDAGGATPVASDPTFGDSVNTDEYSYE